MSDVQTEDFLFLRLVSVFFFRSFLYRDLALITRDR